MPHEASPAATEEFARSVGPTGDQVIAEMDERARETRFPTVGPAVGGWLQLLAGMVDAHRAFEFGSGFGYSAYWIAGALPPDGLVVLTEIDEDELAEAKEYLTRGGYRDRAAFEHGDAVEIVREYEGPFDLVLVDNEKHRYVDAFDGIREKVTRGGVVVADNVMGGPVEFETVAALVQGDDPEANEAEHGIADYVTHVNRDEDFETVLLPLGSGLTVSRRI